MSWISDSTSTIAWLASETFAGQDPRQLQQSFQRLGISAEDFLSWYGWYTGGTYDPLAAGAGYHMSGLSQWLTPAAQQPPAAKQQPSQQAANPLAPGGKPANLTDSQWSVVQGVLRAAQELGVPAPLALAQLYQENPQLDAGAVGDNGCSIGAMQLNTCEGEGVGLPEYVLQDPYLNARVSLTQVQQVMQQHPDWSWGQISAAAQRPADPGGYANAVNGFVDSIQTGQGPLGWAQSLTTGTFTQRQNLPGGASQVPLPFSSSYFQNITQPFGVNGEQGTDFGMPEHQSIVTPVGGTITTRDDGNRNWGRAVYVKMPNGWQFFVGHLFDFAVQDGQVVAPGQVLGTSGGGADAPSPGDSDGPHIEIRFIDPGGQNVDPMGFLQQLYSPTGSGASASNLFSNWMGGMFQGAAQVTPSEATQNLVTTPDQRLLDLNSPTGLWYQAVDNVWTSIYGQHAPLQAAIDFKNAGIQTKQGISDAVNGLPSNIVPGVTIGAWNSLDQTVMGMSNQRLGRPAPQSLVKQFFQQGITTSSDMQLWFDTHSSSDVPPEEYQATWDSMNLYTQKVWNDYPHPDDVIQAWQQAGGSLPPDQPSPDSYAVGGDIIAAY